MRFTLLLLAGACRPASPPAPPVPDLPALPFDAPRALATRLDAHTATLSVPAAATGGVAVQTSWTLGPSAPVRRREDRVLYLFHLPFHVTPNDNRFRPEGMIVHAGTDEIPFDMSPTTADHEAWRVKGGQLFVVMHRPMPELTVTVANPWAQARLARLARTDGGLSDAEYATIDHRDGDTARSGLLLTAPSTASWQVDVPANGRFDAWVEMIDVPGSSAMSDGATVSLSVDDSGGPTVVATHKVRPPSADSGRWWSRSGGGDRRAWAVGLERWAGQTVTVTLSTDGGADSAHDYVFVGAPAVSGTPSARPRRVIVLAVDTLRADHLGTYGYGRATSPEIDEIAGASAVFERAWAPAPRTRPSFRSATTGRGALDAIGAPNVGQTFAAHGFATAGIVANMHLNPRFGFHRGHDLWRLRPSARADEQVDAALAWLRDHQHRDAFVFLHLMDPHLEYEPPAPYDQQFVTETDPRLNERFNRWDVLGWMGRGEMSDATRSHIEALYDGEIAFTSAQVGRFVAAVDALPGDTALLFHTDHGEELWEHGGFEHNHSLYDEVVRAALFLRAPGVAPQRLAEPVALWDIAPTLYDLAGIAHAPPTDGRSLLPLIDGEDPGDWSRDLPVGHMMYDQEQWGVVSAGHKYTLRTWSGAEALYDLASDPAEQIDLSAERDLGPFRQALARAHRMPVGPGWRLEIELFRDRPVVWSLPQPALAAVVLDPEAARTDRANLVWGEPPERTPDDVASVTLDASGTTLTIDPGPDAQGVVVVLFERAPEELGEPTRHGEPLVVHRSDQGWRIRGSRTDIHVRAGTVILPPPGEAARMAADDPASEAATDEALRLLEALGYVGGP